MNTLSYKTVSVSKEAAREQKEWLVIDATDQVVGRLASKVAKIIRGKYKPTFTPNQDCGDNVIIINADKVVFTGKKETDMFTPATLAILAVSVSTRLPNCARSRLALSVS